jgi:5'-nucleotidase
MAWGDAVELPSHTDGGVIEEGFVSVSYLSRLEAYDRPDMAAAEATLAAAIS